MIIRILVIGGVFFLCIQNGYLGAGILILAGGIFSYFGHILLVIGCGLLFYYGEWFIGLIPLLWAFVWENYGPKLFGMKTPLEESMELELQIRDSSSDEFKQGYDAFKYGADITLNPYLTKVDRDYFRKELLNWIKGWELARGSYSLRLNRFMIENGIPLCLIALIAIPIPKYLLKSLIKSYIELWSFLTLNTGILGGIIILGIIIYWPIYRLWRPFRLKLKKSLLSETELSNELLIKKHNEDIESLSRKE